MSIISDNIKFCRKKANLTQDDLAKATNLSVSFISKLETGNKEPSLETIFKITNALGIQPYDIMGQDSKLLNEFIKGMDPEEQDQIYDEMFTSEFGKISSLLEEKGYEVKIDSSNKNSVITILDDGRTVATMLEVDFVNFGNDMLESIDKFTCFSIEDFLKKHNSLRK